GRLLLAGKWRQGGRLWRWPGPGPADRPGARCGPVLAGAAGRGPGAAGRAERARPGLARGRAVTVCGAVAAALVYGRLCVGWANAGRAGPGDSLLGRLPGRAKNAGPPSPGRTALLRRPGRGPGAAAGPAAVARRCPDRRLS